MINWDGSKIIIRPSAIDTFLNCSYQWAKVFLEGVITIPSARAAVGTAIHKAAEVLWTESMKEKRKVTTESVALDAAMEAFKEEKQKGLQFDEAITEDNVEYFIVKGAKIFIEDLMPFLDIPEAVEKRYAIQITHPVVAEIGGTIDYITDKEIGDIKTTQRKATTAHYKTQQSVYKYLAEVNGKKISYSYIQNIVLSKTTAGGQIMDIEADITQAKYLLESMLKTLSIFFKDTVPAEVLFRGNPKWYLCSPNYCSLYDTCPFVKGEI
jgi:hypothetical protein